MYLNCFKLPGSEKRGQTEGLQQKKLTFLLFSFL